MAPLLSVMRESEILAASQVVLVIQPPSYFVVQDDK